MRKFFTLVLITIFITSCEEDDSGSVTTPTVQYSETTANAIFYTEGNSVSPSIEWNGEQGSISLDGNPDGTSVNSTTGKITWTKLLPAGSHDFQVLVANSAGQVTVPFTLENPLQGFFEGTYSGSSYFAIEFFDDGTCTVLANSSNNPTIGSGTFVVDGDEVVADYTYEDTDEDYSVRATISQTSNAAALEGNWYFEHGATTGQEGGTMDITLQ
ncbi:hypothetical protein [Luteirhabdus pelagi]|uniref:hypothetical protein n=1 Tax=Luteirhabdus pelagi TaxID=2792783 RepID=UPI00193A1868|nr:hypothetical protein [Luteirhabdus pelagi]